MNFPSQKEEKKSSGVLKNPSTATPSKQVTPNKSRHPQFPKQPLLIAWLGISLIVGGGQGLPWRHWGVLV